MVNFHTQKNNIHSKHRENYIVASTKRFVNIASANQNCIDDDFSCYINNMNCYQNKDSFRRNKWNCHHNDSNLLRLYQQNVLLRQKNDFLRNKWLRRHYTDPHLFWAKWRQKACFFMDSSHLQKHFITRYQQYPRFIFWWWVIENGIPLKKNSWCP